VFDINGGEMIVLAVVALVVLGPERLPGYAAQAARLIRQLRDMAEGAKDSVREQMGPEFDDVDWAKLDPRQYDPRKIVRDALFEDSSDDKPVTRPAPSRAARPDSAASSGPGAYDDEAT
jgi:sec-independent protein translocase protein TatB